MVLAGRESNPALLSSGPGYPFAVPATSFRLAAGVISHRPCGSRGELEYEPRATF